MSQKMFLGPKDVKTRGGMFTPTRNIYKAFTFYPTSGTAHISLDSTAGAIAERDLTAEELAAIQPDFPRTICIFLDEASTACTLKLVGYDQFGVKQSETITSNGATVKHSIHAYRPNGLISGKVAVANHKVMSIFKGNRVGLGGKIRYWADVEVARAVDADTDANSAAVTLSATTAIVTGVAGTSSHYTVVFDDTQEATNADYIYIRYNSTDPSIPDSVFLNCWGQT